MSVESDAKVISNPQQEKSQRTVEQRDEVFHKEFVTVVSSSKQVVETFSERKDLLLDSFEYPRNGNDPGLVLIFNQQSFDDKTYRLGSRRDVNEIILCMSRLGFNINDDHIFTDLTSEEILKVVQKITSNDLTQVNSLIVFFLSHGDNFNMLYTKDGPLTIGDFWKSFVQCGNLKNKPKMFVFQACKGESHSTIPAEAKQKIDLVPDHTFQTNYIGPDMLVVYSTTEGNVSFRDPQTGTWFIQELCKNFSAYGRRDDAVSLVIRTTKCLGRNYYHHEDVKIKKQMPIFISTLKRKFYLNRYKERHILIKILEDQDSMKKNIEELRQQVGELIEEKEKRNK